MPTEEETVLDYLKRIQSKLADPFHPHPLLKAIALAMEGSSAGKDGNYSGISGDADMHRGVPHLLYAAVIEKRGHSSKILEMKDIRNNVIVDANTLQRIVDAEIEMLNYPDDQLPARIANQVLDRALSPDMRVVGLDEQDRHAAIALTKRLIDEGKLRGTPPAIAEEIKALHGSDRWENLSPEARSTIGSAWATRIGPNTIVVTYVEEMVPKAKVRETIALTLARLRSKREST